MSNRAASLFAVILMSVVLSACGMCGDDVVGEQRSPDGTYAVTTYLRNCGAITPYVTHLNLHPASARPRAAWDGTVRKGEILSVKGKETIKTTWLSSNVLELQVEPSQVMHCADSLDEIQVKCVPPRNDR